MMTKFTGKCLAALLAMAMMFAAMPVSTVFAQEAGDSAATTTADDDATSGPAAEEPAPEADAPAGDESTPAPESSAAEDNTPEGDESTPIPQEDTSIGDTPQADVPADDESASAPAGPAPEETAADTESVAPGAKGGVTQAEEAGALPQESVAEPQAISGSGYRNVGSENLSNPANFYRDVLTMPLETPLTGGGYNGERSVDELYELWHELALTLYDPNKGSTNEHYLHTDLTQSASIQTVKADVMQALHNKTSGGSTHLVAFNNTYFDTAFFTAEQLQSASGPAYFTFDMTSDAQGHQLLTTTIFYDFQLVPLQDAAAGSAIGNGIVTALTENVQPTKSYSNATENRGSSGPVQGSQTVGTSATASVSQHSSSTHEYSFANTVGSETTVTANAPFGLGGVEQTFSLSFTAEELLSTTEGQEIASSKGSEYSTTVATDCPPHTVALMMTESFDGVNTVTYTYPVGIRFKVQTMGFAMRKTPETFAYAWVDRHNFSVSGTAGGTGSALDSLIDRYNNRNNSGYETAYKGPEGTKTVNWLQNKDRFSYATIIGGLSANRPYNSAGGSLRVETEGRSSSVYKYAIYPLAQVRALAPFSEDYTMSGSALYVDGIELEGYNAQNVPYYGFTRDSGRWALLDSNGKDITASGSGVATLKTNPVSGRQYLQAGRTAGHVYLKYLINENCYNHYNNGVGLNTFATNASLTSTAVVRVNVSGDAEDPNKLDPASPDSDKAAADKNTLIELAISGGNMDVSGNVVGNLTLPRTGTNGSIITWTSSDTDVVDLVTGAITRPAYGMPDVTVTLKATIKNGTATETFSINFVVKALGAADITGIKLAQKNLRLAKGQKATVGALVYWNNNSANTDGLRWTSSNEKVATVNQNGKITAKSVKKDSKATITATAPNGKKATVKVTVLKSGTKPVKATKVSVSGVKKALDVGKTAQLKVTVTPENATNAAVTFASSKKDVLRVDVTGKLTALKPGKAKLTVKAGGKKATLTVTVTAPVGKITVDKKSVTLAKKGKTVTITPTVDYSVEGYTAKLSWKSSDTKVATVNSKGKITAKGKGKATITVSAPNGKSAKIKVTVKK